MRPSVRLRFREPSEAFLGSLAIHGLLLALLVAAAKGPSVSRAPRVDPDQEMPPQPVVWTQTPEPTPAAPLAVPLGDGSEGRPEPPRGEPRPEAASSTEARGRTQRAAPEPRPPGFGGPDGPRPGIRVVLVDAATVDAVVRTGATVLAYDPKTRTLYYFRDTELLPVRHPEQFFRSRGVMTDPAGNPWVHADFNSARLAIARRQHPDATVWVGIPAALFSKWVASVPEGSRQISIVWEEYRGFRVWGNG